MAATTMSHSTSLNFPSPPYPPGKAYTTSPLIVAFALGVLICLVVGVFLSYFCRCFVINCIYTRAFRRPTVNNLLRQIYSPNHTANAAAASPIPGINPALLQIFPTFPYSSVKEFQKKNNNNKSYSLECAICLFEFEEDSFLRLLTFCCHVFHQECIDLWLESHKTCPVCRTDLDSLSKEKNQDQNQTIITQNNPEDDHHNDNETRINVREEDEEEEPASGRREEEDEEEGVSGEGDQEKRFSKSHSTGHSIVVIKDDDDDDKKENNKHDKYTLRLPEHVRMKLMRGHNNHISKSCESYMEMTRLCGKCCSVEAMSSSSSCCCTVITTTTSTCQPSRV